MRLAILLLILVALLYAGYQFGRHAGRSDTKSQIIENYSFVKDIAELASLEANGVTTFKSTNLANDGSWSDALRKAFIENTVEINVPYTAKYGVNLGDSAMKIVYRDSLVEIHLPAPQLLSFEIRLDRLNTTAKRGAFTGADDERFADMQKKLYTESRAQLAGNTLYLSQSRARISRLLQEYFKTLGMRAVISWDVPEKVLGLSRGKAFFEMSARRSC